MINELATLIGTHALEFFLVLLLLVLAVIFLLWRLFEAHYPRLWGLMSRLWRRLTGLELVQRLRQRFPWLWSFLGNRLSPQGYLGLHLTLGLILSLVAVDIFGGLAEAVVEQAPLTRFDQALAVSVRENVADETVLAFQVITTLGDTPALTLVGIAFGVALIIGRRWLLLVSWIATLVGAGLLNAGLKAFFQRPRPAFVEPIITESGWSFPSGHTMGSLITYGMLVYLLVLLLERDWQKVVVLLALVLVLLIGFSRMFLGVHFFSDVMAGYAAGALWLAVTISGTEVARRYRQNRPDELEKYWFC